MKPDRTTPASSGWRRRMAVRAATPRCPSVSRPSGSSSTTARASRMGASAEGTWRTASAADTSASAAPLRVTSDSSSLFFWHAVRSAAACSATLTAFVRRKLHEHHLHDAAAVGDLEGLLLGVVGLLRLL